jgi:hypothetical protein
MISAPFIESAHAITDLEDWGLLAEATGAPMYTSGQTMWSGDNNSESGIWECTAGPSYWSLEQNEFVHILSGSMTVTPDEGDSFLAGPGVTFLVPVGWKGTWEIHETIRKLYVLF